MTQEIPYKCWTKAIRGANGNPRRGAAWVRSRRAWFQIFDDRIECGDWIIPFSSVKEAVVFETRFLFMPAFILQLSTAETTYQFGFNPWCRVTQHLPFHMERKRVKMGHSAFSIAARVLLAAYLAYWVWQWMAQL